MAPLQDPRILQTWNNISHNAETATETAAEGLWTFTQNYINPCLLSISSSINECSSQCFPDDERARRLRERDRARGRAEYSFDFYDDWDEEEEGRSGGLLGGWGNDELDRLLAGSGSHSHRAVEEQPPGRRRGMSYGTRKGGPRRKNTIDGLPDPTIIPSSNTLGFLHRLPFKIGGTLRYKPSAADLQEHPGAHRAEAGEEGQPLIDEDNDEEHGEGERVDLNTSRKRLRSSTTGSGDTSDSFRSRGDLFPSDGEDDAVPISDEFAVVLERRMTAGSGMDDRGSGKTQSSKGKRPSASRAMSRTVSRTTQSSSQSRQSLGAKRGSSTSMSKSPRLPSTDNLEGDSLTNLQQEEERLSREEDAEVERKREAAARLASERGLIVNKETSSEVKQEIPSLEVVPPPVSTEDTDDRGEESLAAPATIRNSIAPETSDKPLKQDFIPARLPKF